MAVPGEGQGDGFPVDLSLTPGELVALEVPPLMGTAVARTVVGLAPVRRGRILVGERDVTTAPPYDRQIGYVPAGDGLLPSLTVERNIWYGLPSHIRGDRPVRSRWFGLPRHRRGDRQAQDRMERLTTALDLAPTLHLRPHELDDGQCFHAAVVRAVACLHEVLVVDLPRPVPGPFTLAEVLDRVRAAVRPTVTTAVLVCTPDAAALGGIDRVVRGRSQPQPDDRTGAGRP